VPAGGLPVLEEKSSQPRHFPETGRREGAGGDDPIPRLNTGGRVLIHDIRAGGTFPRLVMIPAARDRIPGGKRVVVRWLGMTALEF